MRKGFRGRLSFANVTAAIALFVALGGASYAITLPKNSVGKREIEPRAVGAAEIARAAVRGSEVRNHSLGPEEFEELPEGPPGPIGPPGVAGSDATKLFAYIREPAVSAPPVVQYGSGVTGVTRDSLGSYVVTFDRSMENCVVVADTGFGDPSGETQLVRSVPEIIMTAGGPADVRLNWARNDNNQAQNTSFLIAGFC
jgi:hypothetical protein